MMRRTLSAFLLAFLVMPLPALCEVCFTGDCPERQPESHASGHGAHHGEMGHGEMQHEEMQPACHSAEPTPDSGAMPVMQARPLECCVVASFSASAPALQMSSSGGEPSTQAARLTNAPAVSPRVDSRLEAREVTPLLGAPPLYTLHSALLL